MRPFAKLSASLCLIIASVTGGQALYIQAKAEVAQVLLRLAWSKSVSAQRPMKAWPWADTVPVARLSIPSMQQDFIVLEGVSGEAMAFGPGRIPGTSQYSSHGVFGIGGHRDTHMAFLETITEDTTFKLQTVDGSEQTYQVENRFVADSRSDNLALNSAGHGLVLITCFPFRAIQTGGPLRYVVVATPVEKPVTTVLLTKSISQLHTAHASIRH